MALILSAATGNFNSTATWVGGVVPTVGDEARASTGHTITITANVTCDEISNAGTGIYTLNDGITLTANVSHKSITASSVCLVFTAASPASGFIVGNLTGSATGQSSSQPTAAASVTSSGTLTITGNCTGGIGNFGVAARNNSTGTLNITGNVIGGSGTNAFGANNNSTGTLNATGNVTGGTMIAVNNAAGGTVNVTGNITGGTAANIYGVSNAGVGTINVTGNVTGGTLVATSHGINNAATGIVAVTGICNGGAAGASGANNASTGTVRATRAVGNAYGPSNSAGLVGSVGVSNTALGICEIEQIEFGTFGQSPTSGTGIRLKKASSNVAIFNYCDTAGAKTLIDATANAAMPAATDVRNGVSYASGALTGSAYIPSASSVASGVPVGSTTGTAVLTAAAIRAELAVELARIDSPISGAGNAPTAVQIRQEMDSASTKLANLDATISSRLASSVSTNITAIKAKTDLLNTDRLAQCATTSIVGSLIAQSNS